MLSLPVLTALVSTPSLTLLTPLMHNDLAALEKDYEEVGLDSGEAEDDEGG